MKENSLQIKIGKHIQKVRDLKGISQQDLAAIDVVLVPALRMDSEGYRLGQGGGFYDRFLPKVRAWKIGLLHDGELSSQKLPREAHDIRLDAAATPDLIIRFKA